MADNMLVWLCTGLVLISVQLGQVQAQENVIFTKNMTNFKLNETTKAGSKIYQLEAKYNGSGSFDIVFGIKDDLGTEKGAIKVTGENFRVEPNGTVFLLNTAIDQEKENASSQLNVVLIAKAYGSDPLIYTINEAKITIVDVNDYTPKFELIDQDNYKIKEGIVPDSPVVSPIHVFDLDIKSDAQVLDVTCAHFSQFPTACEVFEVRSEEISNQFWIGSIHLTRELDYEDSNVWVVLLKAFDGLNAGYQEFVITVIDVQDTPPIFMVDTPTFIVFEEDVKEYLNYSIKAVDGDGDKTKRRAIYFEFMPDPNHNTVDYRNLFRIDGFTGKLYRTVRLDVEQNPLFNHEERSIWDIIVKACEVFNSSDTLQDGSPLRGETLNLDCTKETFRIRISDINDNAPLFSSPEYNYTVQETISNNTYLTPSIEVRDKDGEEFNKFDVSIVGNVPEFGVSGTSQIFNIFVRDPSLIDFENGTRSYNFMLLAVDRNDSSLRSTAKVTIDISDVNDNDPIFNKAEYFATISETARGLTSILQVQATDQDSGIFGTAGLIYSLILDPLFQIQENTGIIEVADCKANTYGTVPCLDYDIKPRVYSGQVKVEDNDAKVGARSDFQKIVIQLLNENDNAPVAKDEFATIFEEQVLTTRPLKVKGTDADGDTLTYSIQRQAPGSYWSINPQTGNITATQPITINLLEMAERFELVVSVSDGGLNTQVNVFINVLDVNNNPPIFQLQDYTISIPENTTGGTYLLTVVAQDADDPNTDNGRIQYFIQSGAGGKFKFDDRSIGHMYTTNGSTFDIQTDLYIINIYALDLGYPANRANATVTVRILDSNNKNPKFNPFSQNATIYDNAKNGAKIFQVKAEDPDTTSKLLYGFEEPKQAISQLGQIVNRTVLDYTNYFIINEVTGEVFLNTENLDSVLTNLLTFRMLVRDSNATSPQEGYGTFSVLVLKYNDSPPRFIVLPKSITIEEERQAGEVVVDIVAVDDGRIMGYEIVSQSDTYFGIVYGTGVVSVKARIDYDDARMTNQSSFTVRAKDSGVPQLSVNGTVIVYFSNINDNSPEFDTGSRTLITDIDENTPTGIRTGLQVHATDADRPDNNGYATIFYVLEDNYFSIDNQTGEIFVNLKNGLELDRETKTSYRLQVRACDTPYDPKGVRRCRSTVAFIQLRDMNDNKPEFSTDRYYKEIFETIGVDTEILPLFTSDEDLGTNAQVAYKKVTGTGDPKNFFDVTPVTGRIYVNQDLNGYTGTYTFMVEARDENGNGPFFDMANITIVVMPAGNSPPAFVIPPKENQTITVLEEQYRGMFVYKVKAIDRDSGLNGVVDYMFYYNGQRVNRTDEFYINSVTGVIHAEIAYNREKVNRYVLLLVASDRGETKLESTRFLTISIKDVNDHAPYFEQNEIVFNLPENSQPGKYIGIVQAFDKDVKQDIFYTIIAGNEDNKFSLDDRNGQLYLADILDSELQQIYFLDIQATNEEKDYTVVRNRRKRAIDPSIITVKLVIGDVNDEAPQFLSTNYYGCISTRSSYKKHIVTISAIDRDAVGTGIVRYRLTGGYQEGTIDLFSIHNKFGVITNSVLMEPYVDRTFLVDVEVRDAELLTNAETATTQAKIFVITPENEASLLIKQNTGEVRLYQEQIQKIISEADELDFLCINNIRDHIYDPSGSSSTLWSDVFVTGVKYNPATDTYDIKSGIETRNIILKEMNTPGRDQDFKLLYISDVEAVTDEQTNIDENAILVVMIIIIVLVFLLIVFCIIAFICIKMAKTQEKRVIVQKSYKEQTPAPAPVQIQAPIYDNRGFSEVHEELVVEPGMYAQVQRQPKPPSPELAREPTPEPAEINLGDEDDMDEPRYEVQIEDSPVPVRKAADEEYTIETQVM